MTRQSGGVPIPNPITTPGGVTWDNTTASGVDLLPTIYQPPIPGNPNSGLLVPIFPQPNITPMQNVFSNLSVQNLIGKPSPHITIGYGVSIPLWLAQTSGRYYFEIAYTQLAIQNGFPAAFNGGIAIGPIGQSYAGYAIDYIGFGAKASVGVACTAGGNVSEDGVTNTGLFVPVDPNIGSFQQGDVIGVAVDLDHSSVWFRCVRGPSLAFDTGSWNGVANGDPVTRTFGAVLSSRRPTIPYAIFGGETSPGVVTLTANFGYSPAFFAIETSFTNPPIFYANWPNKSP